MPCAMEGMSMGIVRTVTHTSAWPILVLVRMNAAARASVTEASVPSSAETMELTSAAPKEALEKTARAPGWKSLTTSVATGATTATRKKATSSKRMVPNPERSPLE